MTTAIEMLPDDPNELKAMLVAERVRNERLVQIIKELQHLLRCTARVKCIQIAKAS